MTILFLCVTSAFSGCGSNTRVLSRSKKLDDDRCDQLLKSALEMLQPDRFGINSYPEAVVGVLTQWSSKCATEIPGSDPLSPEVQALLDGLIAPDEFNLSAKNSNYNKRDVEHIRDCLLLKALVDSVLKTADTDLARTVELFEFVTRHIALLPEVKQPVPLTPFEIILFGQGTSEDRAWIFANLLRQLRIDAVILRPQRTETAQDAGQETKSKDSLPESHWLVGALLDDEVYLFDMRLGLPIPSELDDGNSVSVRTPASLSEVLESDAAFRKLDLDAEKPYPLKSDDFRNVHVEIIGNGRYWFLRMKKLQMSITGESLLIYEELQDSALGDGFVSRIAKFGNGQFNRSDLSFWTYPEKTLKNSQTLAGIPRQKLLDLYRPFDAPLELKTDPQTKRVLRNQKTGQLLIDRPSRKQLKSRIDHIMGRFDKAISQYQMLQLELDLPPEYPIPPGIRQLHGRAQEDAFFWTGVCQMEQGKFSTAAETLQRYVRIHSGRGVWTNQAVNLLSQSYAESDKLAVALQLLSTQLEQNSINPSVRLRYHFLINRWRTLRAQRQSTSTE